MERSKSQVLFRHLPDSVFFHEDGFYAQVHHVRGDRVSDLNRQVLLEELAAELENWAPGQVGIPSPRSNSDEYVILEPTDVSFDIYPLSFECTNPSCGRIRRWWQQSKLVSDTASASTLRCSTCGSKLRQLRYLTAHNCGSLEPIHTPRCANCQATDNVYLEDLGSFLSSSWKCRVCGWSQVMRFTPCRCNSYQNRQGQTWRQGFTARDQRLWYPQTLNIINLSGQTYDNVQRHPQRGIAAVTSWLGDETDLGASLNQLGQPVANRQSPAEWAATEAKLRSASVANDVIANLRALQGPADAGVAAVGAELPPEVIDMGGARPWVERAGLFDTKIVSDRRSFADIAASAVGPSATAAQTAAAKMVELGIADISVTQSFPIVVASYGYSRVMRQPGGSHLRTYAKSGFYDGKTPIFAVPVRAEALIVTFSALAIAGYLGSRGLLVTPIPASERDAKIALAEILADDRTFGGDGAAGVTRRLVHSASHTLLRALDDGQSGFGESSLAEWIVPDTLTTAIYVASYNDFTLGAFDTVLRRRVAAWLSNAAEAVNHCDNDPMCSHTSPAQPHSACDRCLHLTYGCRTWNADLDRKLLRRWWLWTRQRAALTP